MRSIIDRFKRKSAVPVMKGKPLYGDFSSGKDLLDMKLKLLEAEEQFMSLPAAVRSRFKNDPAEIVDFVSKEENRDEAVKLGLIEKTVEEVQQELKSPGGGEPEPVKSE